MTSFNLSTFVYQISLIYCVVSQNIEPAVKISITPEGISQIVLISKKVVLQEFPKLTFPVISVDKDTTLGSLHIEAWDIKIENIPMLEYDVSLGPTNELVVTVSDIGVIIAGEWKCELSSIFHVTDHGTFRFGANRLRLNMELTLGADARGMPTLSQRTCNGLFNDLWLEIHSKYSWVVNFFKEYIFRNVNKPCDILRDNILKEIEKKLNHYNPQIFVGHNLLLDVRLLVAPLIEGNIIKFYHKGEFFYRGDTSEAPFQPDKVPELNPSKMFNIAISEYVFNTLSYVAYEHGLQEGIITRNDLPSTFSDLFNTTCSKILCIGFFIPQLGYLYPNSFVEIQYNSTNFPQLQINPKGMSTTTENIYTFRTRRQDNTSQAMEIFTISVNMTLDMVISMENSSPILHWKITNFTMIASLLDSQIGWIPDKAGALIMEWIIRLIAIPKVDKEGTIGIKIELIKYFNPYNMKLLLQEDYLSVQSDFDYFN